MNNASTPPSTLQRLHERLNQSRYWSYSLLIHAVLLTILSTLVMIRPSAPEELEITGEVLPDIRGVVDIVDPPIERPLDTDPKPTEAQTSQPPPKPSDTFRQTAIVLTKATTNFPIVVDPELPSDATVDPNAIGKAPSWVPASMSDRFTKDASGRIVGGPWRGGTGTKRPMPTKESELAVLRGLDWLRDHQNADGSWGERNKGAMTGLALLCFFGHGELGDSKNYGLAVNKGLEWMLVRGTEHQARLSMTKDGWGPGNGGVYEHGIATYALGEYFTLSKDERVLELLKNAVAHIVAGQAPDGGWMYHFDKTPSDTSVSGWQVQALKAAHLTELNLPGVNGALDRAMKNFDRVQGPNGGYGYRGPEDRYSLTGVGVLCELFWENGRDKDLRRAVKFISEKSDKELPVKYQGEHGDLYAWYYHTQAMLLFGGAAWQDWERKFLNETIKAQSADGSWPVMKAPGHGNLQTDANLTGAVYRTTLSILMLEAYYRYLPAQRGDLGHELQKLAVR